MYVPFPAILTEYNHRALAAGYWSEETKCLYMAFTDFGKVFDGFNHDTLWNPLLHTDLILQASRVTHN